MVIRVGGWMARLGLISVFSQAMNHLAVRHVITVHSCVIANVVWSGDRAAHPTDVIISCRSCPSGSTFDTMYLHVRGSTVGDPLLEGNQVEPPGYIHRANGEHRGCVTTEQIGTLKYGIVILSRTFFYNGSRVPPSFEGTCIYYH